jgi:protocatechuate 3,4-dioxygenase beta subunit
MIHTRNRFVAVLVIVGLTVGVGLWMRSDEGDPGSAPVAQSAPSEPGEPSSLPRSTASGREREQVVQVDLERSASATAAEEVVDSIQAVFIAGRVLDLEDRPVADLEVRLTGASDDWTARSDGRGAFRIEAPESLPRGSHELVVRAETHATLCPSLVTAQNVGREHLVVVARAVNLAGRVVDESGAGIGGARVTVSLASELRRRFPYPLDMTRREDVSLTTEDDGSFEVEGAPTFEGGSLGASAPGHQAASIPIPGASHADLVLRLTAEAPRSEPEKLVEGRVLLPDRSPAEDAQVQYASEKATTDSEGRFRLPFPGPVEPKTILAAGKKGFGTAVIADFGEQAQAVLPHPPGPFTLVLGEHHAIAGNVQDSRGEPAKGWQVSLWRGTELSEYSIPPDLAEHLGRGSKTTTDEQGAFRLTGLADRKYVILAYDQKTLVSLRSAPVHAGTEDLVLRVPADAVYERVAGRVLSRGGLPLKDVQVQAKLVTYSTSFGSSWISARQSALTDEDGTFELHDFPSAFASLELSGESIVPEDFELEAGARIENLRLEVAQRCHFRVEVGPAVEGDLYATMEDEAGENLTLYRFQSRGWTGSTNSQLEAGAANLFTASEDARTLVVRVGEEVRRMPVDLDPGRVTEIHIDE